MLTYELKKAPGIPLYESLYRCIKKDILSGVLKPGEKLPSKRTLAVNLEISKITVESAYSQLLAEGYIRSREKTGYFVESLERLPAAGIVPPPVSREITEFSQESAIHQPIHFPFSVWSRLQREVMLDYGEKLLQPLSNRGCPELRKAIATHLAGFRGMRVSPEQILIGAGTDFLYNLLIQLLGRDKIYGVENPGYDKIPHIYAAGGVHFRHISLDDQGICTHELNQIQVLHISPSHHFPTGIITSLDRRMELLNWVSSGADRWIIEDDYDSEFRFDAHPMAAMQALDRSGSVIYINTFSKTLAPSIRISYMVLPPDLMTLFQKKLGFYSCTVASFEQYTLARFLQRGYFEKHLNRMRKYYKLIRNQVIFSLKNCIYANRFTILEQDAGLHFLLKIDTSVSDEALIQRCSKVGIPIHPLSEYFHGKIPPEAEHCLVVNYASLDQRLLSRLQEILNHI